MSPTESPLLIALVGLAVLAVEQWLIVRKPQPFLRLALWRTARRTIDVHPSRMRQGRMEQAGYESMPVERVNDFDVEGWLASSAESDAAVALGGTRLLLNHSEPIVGGIDLRCQALIEGRARGPRVELSVRPILHPLSLVLIPFVAVATFALSLQPEVDQFAALAALLALITLTQRRYREARDIGHRYVSRLAAELQAETTDEPNTEAAPRTSAAPTLAPHPQLVSR